MERKKSVKKRGGQRPGAGRKKTDEPTEPVTIYVKKTSIQHHGGKNALKIILTKVAESNVIVEAPAVILPKSESAQKKVKDVVAPQKPAAATQVGQIDKKWALGRIKELEDELKNPPKNPIIGLTYWKRIRETELEKLKSQL
jgi:hypothetical protein